MKILPRKLTRETYIPLKKAKWMIVIINSTELGNLVYSHFGQLAHKGIFLQKSIRPQE